MKQKHSKRLRNQGGLRLKKITELELISSKRKGEKSEFSRTREISNFLKKY